MPEVTRVFVNPGRVLLAFRHLPLESIHPFARRAAETAWCAAQQGQFWSMHDALFENPSRLDDSSLRQHAQRIGLELRLFDACLASGHAASSVGAEAAAARDLGVSVTPSFLLGVRLDDGTVRAVKWLTGSLPFAELQRELERAFDAGGP